MAAIDKIYGTRKQYIELRQWLHKTGRKLHLTCMYDDIPRIDDQHKETPISNFACWMDRDLWLNCPLEFVRERLIEQYNGEPIK
jgi:hypothetical protein